MTDLTATLAAGDLVLLVDAKKRRYLVTLEDGGEFHSHAGVVPHGDLIGQPEGASVRCAITHQAPASSRARSNAAMCRRRPPATCTPCMGRR